MTLLVACGLRREARIIARTGVTVVAGGGDAARLERALEAAVGAATAVLSCGVAGALDPWLRAGDVVVGTVFPGESRDPVSPHQFAKDGVSKRPSSQPNPGTALAERLAALLPHARRGAVVGADAIVGSVAEKAAFRAATGAIAVDMESHVAARVAERHGLPFAILRTISDSADHALPPAALVGMKRDGGVALGAILASLARDPAQLPALIRTGQGAGAAFRSLRRALRALEALGIGGLDPGEFALDMR